MVDVVASLQLRLAGLRAARESLKKKRGPFKAAFKEVGGIYTAYVLKQFDANSRGGGKWRPLKPATISLKGSSAILVDTRALRQGLGSSIEVTVQTEPRLSLIAKFKGRRRHRRAKMSIADLATIHHLGLGRVPQRRILVQPDARTANQMSAALVRAVKKAMSK